MRLCIPHPFAPKAPEVYVQVVQTRAVPVLLTQVLLPIVLLFLIYFYIRVKLDKASRVRVN